MDETFYKGIRTHNKIKEGVSKYSFPERNNTQASEKAGKKVIMFE